MGKRVSFVVPRVIALLGAVLAGAGLGGVAAGLDTEPAMEAVGGPMVRIPGGRTLIGATGGPSNEQPVFEANVKEFYLDRTPVTVAAYRAFVKATGYRTDAERFGDAAVMHLGTGEWTLVPGASWHHPFGPDKPAAADDHPVTQVSWRDAKAYCTSVKKRLPTEIEWEHAARSGSSGDVIYAFGDQLFHDGDYLANVWTGIFPVINDVADGYVYTSPVGQFGETPVGLTDMAGNVWEWTEDWYHLYGERPASPVAAGQEPRKVLRGGSYLCDANVCHGFRVSARIAVSPESSLMHVGFRCAR